MALVQLDSENADRNLTSTVTVLTDTPDASEIIKCQGIIKLGDGAKNLDGTGGVFEVTITIGGQTWNGGPENFILGTEVRAVIVTGEFPVPANDEVIMRVKSPNVADDDVDVTATLYDVSPGRLDDPLVSQLSDIESQLDVTDTTVGATFARTTVILSNISDVESQLDVTDTVVDVIDSRTLVAQSAISDIDSQLDLNASNISDNESQMDAGAVLNTSTLSDIASNVWGNVTDAGANKLADHTLRRAVQSAIDSADGDTKGFRSPLGAVSKLVNKVSIDGTTLRVFEDDDATELGTQSVAGDSGAIPIIRVTTN